MSQPPLAGPSRMRVAAISIAIVAMGAWLRVALSGSPNFAPVAALALFAGYLLPTRWLALAAPLGIMACSDAVLGGYGYDWRSWSIKTSVYGALLLPVLLGPWLRRSTSAAAHAGKLVGASLGASISFFLITNTAVWLCTGLYPLTPGGLLQCYVQAVPFFRSTVASDLLFTGLLFGLLAAWRAAPRRELQPERVRRR